MYELPVSYINNSYYVYVSLKITLIIIINLMIDFMINIIKFVKFFIILLFDR